MSDSRNIMATRALYYEDAYATEFEATVIACEKVKQGYELILDQTLFFPEGGGQYADTGVIGDANVSDVQIRDGVIYHLVDKEFTQGVKIKCKIDWEKRFDAMQQHTAEHVFSGLMHEKFGVDNIGFHLGKDFTRMDFNKNISKEDIYEIEVKANEILYKNLEVKTLVEGIDEIPEDYRAKKEIFDNLRVVVISGVDACACCAPHLSHIGEIGIIKVASIEKYKGGVRIYMVAGARAVTMFKNHDRLVGKLVNYMNAAPDSLYESIVKLDETKNKFNEQINGMMYDMLELIYDIIPKDVANKIVVCENANDISSRKLINKYSPQTDGFVGVFSGNDSLGYKYIVGAAAKDCKELLDLMKEELGAKGGGSTEMIQGSVAASADEIYNLFK